MNEGDRHVHHDDEDGEDDDEDGVEEDDNAKEDNEKDDDNANVCSTCIWAVLWHPHVALCCQDDTMEHGHWPAFKCAVKCAPRSKEVAEAILRRDAWPITWDGVAHIFKGPTQCPEEPITPPTCNVTSNNIFFFVCVCLMKTLGSVWVESNL
jgi:hypothetical protein